jgi:hypothetical protein
MSLTYLLLCAAVLHAQSPASEPKLTHPFEINAPDGGFHISGTLCRYSEPRKSEVPELIADVTAKRTNWQDVALKVTIGRGGATRDFDLSVGPVKTNSPTRASLTSLFLWADQLHGCEIDTYRFTFVGGRSEAEERRVRAAAAAARKGAADAAAAHARYLASLPTLQAGAQVAFLGADRKCAEQFQQALGMDGLEKRKRIADLVSYGCGVIVDGTARITIGTRDGNYSQVTIADGKHTGKEGWVPNIWVK